MKRRNRNLEIHVGDNLDETGRRFVAAWHRLEKGQKVRERHVSFESLEGLLSILTPKRWELLRHVHRKPASSIRALSIELGRDYRRVHDDVVALGAAGLLEREGREWRADYDAIDSTFRFAQNGAGRSAS
jgi:predicted transcriptional regulator